MSHRYLSAAFAAFMMSLTGVAAVAQPIGTFRWQLQPFCNVVTVSLTQQGAVYAMDGFDDQCGAPQRAALVGLATPNTDGSIQVGLNLVTAPGGRGVQVAARITLPSASGTWSDSAGNAGTFAFGASTGGSPRPIAAGPAVPGAFSLLADGGFVARGTGDTGSIPASGPGTRMMWFPSKAAFRAGFVRGTQWDDTNIGVISTAMGIETIASGLYSTALGAHTTASGTASTALGASTTASGDRSTALGDTTTAGANGSTAMGASTRASGLNSTAMGDHTTASGTTSIAMGRATTASGSGSTAMGVITTASGVNSTALGHLTTASGESSTAMGASTRASGRNSHAMGFQAIASGDNSTAIGTSLSAAGGASVVMGVRAATTTTGNGSFVYGDQSTGQSGSIVTSISPNQFLVRASGGVMFWSTDGTTFPTSPGVALYTGDSAWSNLSDVNSKENFRDLADEDVLAKIAAMPVREWNYKAQGAAIRHVGPTAQDFHAAFGLGAEPRRINTVDADGIALAAVKALEARTRALTRENDDLRARLARLEALLDKR